MSYENQFYHNNFLDNLNHVHDESWEWQGESPSVNKWDDDYPSGGNYWSGFSLTDDDNDGICDQPYVIDSNNTDR